MRWSSSYYILANNYLVATVYWPLFLLTANQKKEMEGIVIIYNFRSCVFIGNTRGGAPLFLFISMNYCTEAFHLFWILKNIHFFWFYYLLRARQYLWSLEHFQYIVGFRIMFTKSKRFKQDFDKLNFCSHKRLKNIPYWRYHIYTSTLVCIFFF